MSNLELLALIFWPLLGGSAFAALYVIVNDRQRLSVYLAFPCFVCGPLTWLLVIVIWRYIKMTNPESTS